MADMGELLQYTRTNHHLKERSFTLGPATLAYFPSFASSSMSTDPGLIVMYGFGNTVQTRNAFDIRLLIAVHDSKFCKSAVPATTLSLQVECDLYLPRRFPTSVGHSPPSSSSFVCKSSI